MSENLQKKLALFIDFENIARGVRQRRLEERVDLQAIVDALTDQGRVLIKRAYGDWSYFRDYRSDLLRQSIEPIQVFAASRDREGWKNGADIRMAIDAIETALRFSDITDFVLVSGDSDFLSLVSRLRENGRTVWGIGLRSCSSQFLVNACDQFLYYEDIAEWSPNDRDELSEERPDSSALLLATVRRMADRQGLPGMPPPGTPLKAAAVRAAMRRTDPNWDERFEGFNSFVEFVQSQSEQILCGRPADLGEYYLAEIGSMAESNLQRMLDSASGDTTPHEALPPDELLAAIRGALRTVGAPEGDREQEQAIAVRGAQLKAQLRRDLPGFDETVYGFASFLDFLLSLRENFRVVRPEPRGDVLVAEIGSPAEATVAEHPEATVTAIPTNPLNGTWNQSDTQRYVGALRIGRIRYVPAEERYKVIQTLWRIFQEAGERGQELSLKEAKDELHEWFEEHDPSVSWDSVNNVVYHMFWTYCFDFASAADDSPLWDRATSWAGGDTTPEQICRRCDSGLVRKIAEVVGNVDPSIVVDVLGDGDESRLEYFAEICDQVNQRFPSTYR